MTSECIHEKGHSSLSSPVVELRYINLTLRQHRTREDHILMD